MYIFVRGFSRAYKIYDRGGIYPMGLYNDWSNNNNNNDNNNNNLITYISQVFITMIKCALH